MNRREFLKAGAAAFAFAVFPNIASGAARDSVVSLKGGERRKYMALREVSSKQGMDGTMR